MWCPVGGVATRTLPGEWSVTSAKLPNQRAWEVALRFLLGGTEAEVGWGCVGVEEWTAAGLQAPEAQVDRAVSAGAGGVIAVDSEGVVEWIEEVSAGPDVEDHPWTEWGAEAGGWAHQEAR